VIAHRVAGTFAITAMVVRRWSSRRAVAFVRRRRLVEPVIPIAAATMAFEIPVEIPARAILLG